MKAKRFLSVMLSLVLAGSLAAPALAGEAGQVVDAGFMDRYEFIEQYIASYPVAEDFDADAWYQEYYAWDFDDMTKEQYMEWMELSEEQFRTDMWQTYVWEMGLPVYDEAEAAYNVYVVEYYEATHPGELESLPTDELLAWAGYTETMTPVEQYMKDWELEHEDEVRPALLYSYAMGKLNGEKIHADFLAYQVDHPEAWAGFDAETYFEKEYSWYDSKEEYMKSCELTEEEFVEAMFVEYVEYYLADGGNADGDNEDWYWDGQDYQRLITLYANGQCIDTDVTAADGVTYADPAVLNGILGTQFPGSDPVSIRSAAETAGWDVVWNSYRRQVVLLDREKLLTGVVIPELGWVEEDISGLDRLAERLRETDLMEPGQSRKTTGTVEVTCTAFNSLDGDEDYTARIEVETLSRDRVSEMSLTMELADLLRLLPVRTLEEVKARLPRSVKDLAALLGGVKVNMIWNGETGMLYVNAPIMALIDPTAGMEADAWYAFDLSELLETGAETFNTAQALYQSLLEKSETGWSSAESSYSDWMVKKSLLHILFGPHAVTETDGTLTWKLDGEAVNSAISAALEAAGLSGSWDGYSFFKECRVELTIDPQGGTSLDMALRPDMQGITAAIYHRDAYDLYDYSIMTGLLTGRLLDMTDFRIAAGSRNTRQGGSGSLELHRKNSFKLTMELESLHQDVETVPRSAPPEGATVVEQ